MNDKKVRFQVNNKWSKWYDFDKVEIPNKSEAVEVKETLTLSEIKKDLQFYKLYKEQILN